MPPLRCASVVKSLGGELQIALFVSVQLLSGDVFPFGSENVGGDVPCDVFVEFG